MGEEQKKEPMDTKQAIDHIRKSKKVKDYEFKNEGVTRINIPSNNNTNQNQGNLGDYTEQYHKLIRNKILKDRNKTNTFMNDVIIHRKKVLQHRLIGDLTLYGSKGKLAKLQIPYCLIEHGTIITQIVNGRTIDQYTIKTIANEIRNALEPEGIKTVEITEQPYYEKGTNTPEAICNNNNLEISYR